MTRAMGDSESTMEFVGAFRWSLCSRGDGRRLWRAGVGGPLVTLCRSGEVSSSLGGAAGNLKLLEKELDGLRVVIGICGVLGVVVMPGRRLPDRDGKANSLELSWPAGGEESPPARGEGCVADRWPGEFTVALSALDACQLDWTYLDRSWACPGQSGDCLTGRALVLGERVLKSCRGWSRSRLLSPWT
jgi:hypothetical protein